MVQRVLVDTDILIDAGIGVEAAVNRLESEIQSSTLAISTITQNEQIRQLFGSDVFSLVGWVNS